MCSVLVDISLAEHSEVKDLKRGSENLAFGAMDGILNAPRTRGERFGICRVWVSPARCRWLSLLEGWMEVEKESMLHGQTQGYLG
jgi:hypothetical protein